MGHTMRQNPMTHGGYDAIRHLPRYGFPMTHGLYDTCGGGLLMTHGSYDTLLEYKLRLASPRQIRMNMNHKHVDYILLHSKTGR